MKTKDELNALKEEIKTLNRKLRELTEEELKEVTGGALPEWYYGPYPTINGDCVLCSNCADACPTGAIYQSGDRYTVNINACNGCRVCVSCCPTGAISM